jgi:putative membrane protein (TIGR04086 family)
VRQTAFLASILVASLILPLTFGWWVAQRAGSDFVLHGFLVGVVAALVYLIVAGGQPEPPVYVVANVLKLGGGALGGIIAAHRGKAP